MIDKPLTFNVRQDKTHVCFVLPTDGYMPVGTYIHPCFAIANEDGYVKNPMIAWKVEDAKRFAYQYNTEVLKLTAGQAEAILVSSMRYPRCPYPQHYEQNKELFEKIGQKVLEKEVNASQP